MIRRISMELKIIDERDISKLRGDALVVGAYEGNRFTEMAKAVDVVMGRLLTALAKDLDFKAKLGDTIYIPSHGKKLKVKNVILVGLGKKKKLDEDGIRKAISSSLKKAKEIRARDIFFEPLGEGVLGGRCTKVLAEGALLGDYEFRKYKKDNEKIDIESVSILADKSREGLLKLGKVLGEVTNFTRDIVNEPGNAITPNELARIAKELSKEYGFECTVYGLEEIIKNKMNGILAVGQGSKNPPTFTHIAYRPEGAKSKVVIIGKGITFDSGGLNIKPERSMKTMKCDKSGACAVLGIMKAIGEIRPEVEVHGLIPSAENMPSGEAFRPDDIITFANGKSVEIHSTDAEGRLILADALIYGSRIRPDIMIDMATLTGACVVALGSYTTGLFSNDDNLARDLLNLSIKTGEKMWRLPLDEDLRDEIKGAYSDIKNVGSRYGGAITAGLFLKEFVGKDIRSWAHLDIAGPAFLEKPWKYYAKGATGVPVRTVVELILNLNVG